MNIFGTFFHIAQAGAEGIDVSEYEASGNSAYINNYLQGVISAYVAANADLTVRKQRPLFCPPPLLRLQGANVNEILDSEIQYLRRAPDFKPYFPIEHILLSGMRRIFPCK